jgi:phytanoyl-CoA hydroxylase
VTGFWIALEDATIDNGCLWVARGGHAGRCASSFAATAEGVRVR